MPERADAARNRQTVLAAAHRLICDGRTTAPSMDEIAIEAGVGKGTLFRRFGDRSGLITELVDSETEASMAEAIARTREDSADPADRAIRFMADICDLMFARRPIMRALATLGPEARYGCGGFQTWLDRLIELITMARPDLDAECIATGLFGSLDADVLDHLLDQRGMSQQRIRAGVVQLTGAVLRGPGRSAADLELPPVGCDAGATNSEGTRGSRCESGAVPPL